ncbi:response regulator [Nitrospina gracilis]|uniref:response regulator n=1 Tax=Nitrospina gracilis TaxID=35801 RepID=UPI001F0270F3|nr:response regulator [Nitrospina gracilis]MCF8719471.1 PleD family two-component response regulator [Nitrospina gracilis Nb-211]
MTHSETTRPTILLIDDSLDYLKLMVEVLKNDYEIQVALDGIQGLRLAQSHKPPDLILLDICMPEMNGYEVCKYLKAHPVSKNIPVIFLSALHGIEEVARGFEVGAMDYITKPINISIVQARIKTHLKLYHQSRLLETLLREKMGKQPVSIIKYSTVSAG